MRLFVITNCRITVLWDVDAKVWTASSEDVSGLATEADTLEALTEKLRILVPELLQLNHDLSLQIGSDDRHGSIMEGW